MTLKIISGGQTGVDQGALHAAIHCGIKCGGWTPKRWKTENGKMSQRLRSVLVEHSSSNYLARTKKNVAEADATLILSNVLPLNGGTLKTKVFCQELSKPFLVLKVDDEKATMKICDWLMSLAKDDVVLNIAGPRESKASGIQKKTKELISLVIQEFKFKNVLK